MDFQFRDKQLDALETLHKQSHDSSRMSVLIGRRRVGKTSLALEFVKGKPHLYLFVAKKSEPLLCQSFIEEIERKLNLPIRGSFSRFIDILAFLMDYAKKRQITVVIDEFQRFYSINPTIFSDIQGLWDRNKNETKMHIIFIGSIYSMMTKIFEDEKEPLFGRADRIFRIRPFSIKEMQKILQQYGVGDLERLFIFYVITGCVPKHLDILLTNDCVTLPKMLDYMLQEDSPFLYEGKQQLIEEFGKDYTVYFSILELLSRGKTSTSEIESVLQKSTSAYIDRLESSYHVIQKYKPITAKPNSKTQKYRFIDNFLQFWFRFIHRNRDAIEIHNYNFIKEIINRELQTYSGKLLEKFFIEIFASTTKYNRIGSYWERSGENEIDIVAVNDLDKIVVAAEVKMNEQKNSQARLEFRAESLRQYFPGYDIECVRLSLSDAQKYLDKLE